MVFLGMALIILGGIAILSQLGTKARFRDILEELLPGFAAPAA